MRHEPRSVFAGLDHPCADSRRGAACAPGGHVALKVVIQNMRTRGGMNAREHHMARSRRVNAERMLVAAYINRHPRPETPLVVTLTRVAPSNGLDDDNLASALKGVRDQVAGWLGVDDRHRHIVRYEYAQRRGPWAVEIEIAPMVPF